MNLKSTLEGITEKIRMHQHSIVVGCILVLAFFILSASVVARLSQDRMAHEFVQVRNHLMSLNSQMSNIQPPKDIELGQRDTVLSNIITSSEMLAEATTESPGLPNQALLKLHFGIIPAQARAVTPAYRSYSSSLEELDGLATHHREVLSILQPLLEYNPRVDIGGEMPETERKSRVNSARDGIATIANYLQQAQPLNDKDDLTGIGISIDPLLEAADDFASNPDTDAWIAAVVAAQQDIVANRQAFWVSSSDITRKKMLASNSSLARLERPLR